jgi:hypothetical protein
MRTTPSQSHRIPAIKREAGCLTSEKAEFLWHIVEINILSREETFLKTKTGSI